MLKNFDFLILLSILIISILGLTIVRSIAPALFISQLVFLFIGFLVFLFFSFFDYRIFQNYSWFLYGLTLVLLVLPFIFGQVTRGATRWIQVGSFTFQPSEIAKPLIILFLAGFFSKYPVSSIQYPVFGFFLLLLPAFLIFRQPDLGSSLVVLAIFAGVFFASGVKIKRLLSGGLLLAAGSPLAWRFLAGYQKERILSFINPRADPLGAGYNLIQSVIAVGSGMIFGRGLGRGTQSHLYFLPERHSDFIFASLSEELGLAGGLLLLTFYFLLLGRILKVAASSQDNFGFLIGIGVFSFLGFQAFVNIGMNLAVLPITGITLPLVSAGGSSILATMISLGLVESVARAQKREEGVRIR